MAKKSKKTDSKHKGSPSKFICKYDLGHEGGILKMVAKCRDCPGRHSLDDRNCLGGIILAYSKEFNVDMITLSHFIETQYYDHSIDLLRNMIQFSSDMENLSMRDPAVEYFRATSSAAQRKLPCASCTYNPKIIFAGFKELFIKDILEFYSKYKNILIQLQMGSGGSTEHCSRCIKATTEDLDYIYNKFEELTKDIIKKGFSIVLGAQQVA